MRSGSTPYPFAPLIHPLSDEVSVDRGQSVRKKILNIDEVHEALNKSPQAKLIVSPKELAALLGLSVKTIYEWIAKGYLNGALRKRGKHNLILRDRALQQVFDGPDWK
jgi:excisionase family DNA binding protein